jgi:hypothetical protein
VERRGKWRALAVRRLSSHVILIRIPSDTRGGTIGYSFGKRRRKTKLRYDVVTKRNAASLRDRTKPESISARTAAKALKPIKSALKKCRGEDARRRRVNVRVTVSGRTGVVSSVEIIGNKGKNLNTGCVRRLVKSVVFPLFELTSHSIAVPLRM